MPRAPSHTRLQHRVTNAKDCPPWPPLPVHLAEIILNPIRGTLANNDLHEFLGDRVMRVFVVKISEQYAKSVSHLTRVTQTLCTNDTFGRLAYSLGLHTHAKLTPSQQESIKAWNPSSWESPPKVLADLFEALIGGIYITYGMRGIREWLEAFFDSLDSDTWKDLSLPVHVVPVQEPRPKSRKETWITSVEQDLLVNWIRANSSSIWVQATHFLDELRPGFSVHSTTYPLKAEVGDAHLRLFICNEIIRRYPWYLQAASGASHLATCITNLIMSDTVLASISRILSLDKFLPRTQFSTKDYATILKVAIGSLDTSITDITGKSNIVQKFLGTVVNLAHAVIYDTNSPFIPAIALPLEWKQYATTRRQLSKLSTPSTDFSSSSPPPPFSTETDAHIRRVHSLQTPHAPRRIPSSLRTPIAQPSPLAHKSSQSCKSNVRPPPTRTAMKRVVFESPLQPESKEGQEPSNDSDDSFSISSTPRSTHSLADELDKLTLKDRPESSPAVPGDHLEGDEFGPRPAPPNFTTVAEAASKIATTKTRQNASEATIRESTDPQSESEADMDISESEAEEVPPLDTRVRIQWRAHLKEKTHLFNEPQPLRHAISTVEIRRNAIRRLAGGQ